MGVALRGLYAIKPHLVRDHPEERTALVRVRAVLRSRPFDPVLGAEAPLWQLPRRRWIRVIDEQAELVLPATGRAERVVLMLPQDVRREPVRVRLRLPLGVREQVDLAVRLLERLANLVCLDPAPPGDHVLDRAADRVPQLHLAVVRYIERPIRRVDEAIAGPYPGARVS